MWLWNYYSDDKVISKLVMLMWLFLSPTFYFIFLLFLQIGCFFQHRFLFFMHCTKCLNISPQLNLLYKCNDYSIMKQFCEFIGCSIRASEWEYSHHGCFYYANNFWAETLDALLDTLRGLIVLLKYLITM